MNKAEEVALQPHQQRVVDEHTELQEKTSNLAKFILDNAIYLKLEKAEQDDLRIQYSAMYTYCYALSRRISRF